MTLEEYALIAHWQSSDGGKAEMAIHAIAFAVDDLKEAMQTRDGTKSFRENIPELMAAKRTIEELIRNQGLFVVAAE